MSPQATRTVLVTGAAGFIGSHLVGRLLREPGVRTVALSRRVDSGGGGTVRVCEHLEQLKLETWQAAGIESLDVIFHLAAFTPKQSGEGDQLEELHRSNLKGTRVLLESLPSVPTRIVFSSTLDVYAPMAHGAVIDEASPTRPTDLYGASKLFCEQQVREYAREHGCQHAILRYGHVFGPGEERYEKLIPNVIRTLLRGEPPLIHGDGSAERDLLYVDDAVEATLRASSADPALLDPVNIVRGQSASIRRVVELLVSITGFADGWRSVPQSSTPRCLRFNAQRMREALGTWDLVSLEEGLRREVDHFRALSP